MLQSVSWLDWIFRQLVSSLACQSLLLCRTETLYLQLGKSSHVADGLNYGTLVCCREIAAKYDLPLLCTVKIHVPPILHSTATPPPPPPPVHWQRVLAKLHNSHCPGQNLRVMAALTSTASTVVLSIHQLALCVLALMWGLMSTGFRRDCSTTSHSLLSTVMIRMEQKLFQYLSFLKVSLCFQTVSVSNSDHLQCIKMCWPLPHSQVFTTSSFDRLRYPNMDGEDLRDLVMCVMTGDRG